MATPGQRTRRRGGDRKDISIVVSTPAWRENPAFVQTAVDLGHFVSCEHSLTDGRCDKVIGVGLSLADAASDALDQGTGVRIPEGWRCNEHKPKGPTPKTPPPGSAEAQAGV